MIKKAKVTDIDELMRIYEAAKAYMRANGNHSQWQNGYPYREIILDDIKNGNMYSVVADDGHLCACFGLFEGDDPTYVKIDGAWADATPYAAIHRVASDSTQRGIFRSIFKYASERFGHLRIDTHEDNQTMQRAVTSCGFEYRGIIYLSDGAPRLAYEWSKQQTV